MTDQEKIKRTLQILMDLTHSFGVSISNISERHGISERTVYRYIQSFKEAGFDVENINGYYRILKDNGVSRDISELLHFSKEESYLLQKSIHSLDENNEIKQSLIQKLYTLYSSRNIADTIIRENAGENVRLLCEAIENKKQVVLKGYHSASGATISDREVEPYGFTTNYVSVWCYDLKNKENRLFKTSRIGRVDINNCSWQHEKDHQIQETDVFRMVGKEQYHLTMILSMRAANLLKEEYPLSEKHLTSLPGNKYRFQGIIYSLLGAARFILGLMDEIEVIEPEELKEYMNEKIRKKFF